MMWRSLWRSRCLSNRVLSLWVERFLQGKDIIMLTKQIRLFLLIMVACVPQVCTAEVLSLDDALRATYIACVGIDDNLADLKKMAGNWTWCWCNCGWYCKGK